MSENYPQGGTPNPYGTSNPYGDSNVSGHQTPPPAASPYQNPDAYPPASPYQNPNAYPAAQNWDPNQNQFNDEGNKKATISLVLGIVSFFFLGIILSIPGYFIAKQAEAMGGDNAKAAKIINLISIGVSILGVLFFILIFVLGAAGSATHHVR